MMIVSLPFPSLFRSLRIFILSYPYSPPSLDPSKSILRPVFLFHVFSYFIPSAIFFPSLFSFPSTSSPSIFLRLTMHLFHAIIFITSLSQHLGWVYDNDVEVHASVDYGVGWRLKIILLYEYDKSMKTLVLKNIINPMHGD